MLAAEDEKSSDALWQYQNNRWIQTRTDDDCNHYLPLIEEFDGGAKGGICTRCLQFVVTQVGEDKTMAEQPWLNVEIHITINYYFISHYKLARTNIDIHASNRHRDASIITVSHTMHNNLRLLMHWLQSLLLEMHHNATSSCIAR